MSTTLPPAPAATKPGLLQAVAPTAAPAATKPLYKGRGVSTYIEANKHRMMLFIGEPMTGKTRAACGWPKPWVLDCNRKLHSVLNVDPSLNLDYDFSQIDASDKPVALGQQWDYALKLVSGAASCGSYETIIIDDFGVLVQALMVKLLESANKQLATQGKQPVDNLRQQDYGHLLTTLVNTLVELKRYQRTFIFTAHQVVDRDETTGKLSVRLAIPGQAATTLPGMFSDVYGFFVETPPGQAPKFRIRTTRDHVSAILGSTRPIADVIDITGKKPSEIYKLLGN